MKNQLSLTEEQLRNLISETITNILSEGVDEVNWFKRQGANLRNAFANAKNQVGGAAAGLKAGMKYGGTNAASAGRNDYLAKKNADLASSRQQECEAAIEEFRQEYGRKVGELNKWKAKEIAQIKKMYGADAFAQKSKNAQTNANAARDNQSQFWGYNSGAGEGVNQYQNVAESIDRAVSETLRKLLA